MPIQDEPGQAKHDETVETLPSGMRLLRTLRGHSRQIFDVAFDPRGEFLATASRDNSIHLWDLQSGEMLNTLRGHHDGVYCVAFDGEGSILASGSGDNAVKLWDTRSGKLLRTLEGHDDDVNSVAFRGDGEVLASGSTDNTVRLWNPRTGVLLSKHSMHRHTVWCVEFDPTGRFLATGSSDNTVMLWNAWSGEFLRRLDGHQQAVYSVAFSPDGRTLTSGSADHSVKVWDVESGRLLRTLEGHTGKVDRVTFSRDGRLLASGRRDHTIRLWDCETWETVAIVPAPTNPSWWIPAFTFHPLWPLLAVAGTAPNTPVERRCRLLQFWQLDGDALLRARAAVAARAVHHTTGKIVLVGDHSVGKSALGYRMIHGVFKEQSSTHGQQFWVFPALGRRRVDGTDCEAILWDFAGQPDYRLVHALFLDDADLALVLFDASDLRDPLHGVSFWLKQLQGGETHCPILLVAAQADRGSTSLTPAELAKFCRSHGIEGPLVTSAVTGEGVDELIACMKSAISWENKPATVTTTTFKRIKDHVLGLKETEPDGSVIVTPEQLRRRLEAADAHWRFTEAEMLTAVGHLENYGYVRRLRTSRGELRILLEPHRLNNLASSLVLEARRNPKGLGALEERQLLTGGYDFPELKDLHPDERDVLLDSAALLFLEHNVCFRETDPLRMETYLVFPELINLKKPAEEESVTEDGVAYTVTGVTENLFASLVVLLGYTHTFIRANHWHSNARYEVGTALVCGFRQDAERDGELDFVLCFGPQTGSPVRTLFQGLFESFLARRNLTVRRYEPVQCSNPACGQPLDRSVVRQRINEAKSFAFCNDCGEKLALSQSAEPIQLTREVEAEVEAQRRTAEQRTLFEQAAFRVRTYASEQNIKPPECFISYAWGVPEHERWVEKRLAADLQKAGIKVVLDRWHNAQIGASVSRFVEYIEESDRIVVVGTPLYREKYENRDSRSGYVVAAEVDVISNRLLGTEAQKLSVLPVLLDGEKTAALPALLHGRVHADFRDEFLYFTTAFDLILSLYQLPPNHPAVTDLRESLSGSSGDRPRPSHGTLVKALLVTS